MHRLLLHGALTVLASTGAAAQGEPPGCFRGRPLPACGAFWIMEAGVRRQVLPATSFREHKVAIEVGRMFNRGERAALGATAFLVTNFDDESRLGLTVRARRWRAGGVGFDVGAGPSFALSADTGGTGAGVGFLAETSASFGDWFAVFTQVELVPASQRYGYGTVQWHVGMRVGSYLGAAGGLAALVGVAAKSWNDAWSW